MMLHASYHDLNRIRLYLDFSCVLLLLLLLFLFIASVETCKFFVMFVRYYCIRGGLIS